MIFSIASGVADEKRSQKPHPTEREGGLDCQTQPGNQWESTGMGTGHTEMTSYLSRNHWELYGYHL